VISQHGDHRHVQAAQLGGYDASLVEGAVAGQITGQQQCIGALA
jgi:hypothetical protein